jgi:hypothetical protein
MQRLIAHSRASARARRAALHWRRSIHRRACHDSGCNRGGRLCVVRRRDGSGGRWGIGGAKPIAPAATTTCGSDAHQCDEWQSNSFHSIRSVRQDKPQGRFSRTHRPACPRVGRQTVGLATSERQEQLTAKRASMGMQAWVCHLSFVTRCSA